MVHLCDTCKKRCKACKKNGWVEYCKGYKSNKKEVKK